MSSKRAILFIVVGLSLFWEALALDSPLEAAHGAAQPPPPERSADAARPVGAPVVGYAPGFAPLQGTPTPTATPCAVNLVVNGGFESGAFPPWVVLSSNPAPVVSNLQAHTGTFSGHV